MIPCVVEKYARHYEAMANEAEAAGHGETAGELYWSAAERYCEPQHVIFKDDDPERIYLHGKLLACFDKVMTFAPHPIERLEIPFEGTSIQTVLHMVTNAQAAPTVVFCPGADLTKEARLDPHPTSLRATRDELPAHRWPSRERARIAGWRYV